MEYQLPEDPVMLLSVINMKLRDQYANLERLCEDMQVPQEELCQKLEQIGYRYDADTNQFI